MIRTVIIDDEPKVRESLAHLLQSYCPDLSLCGMADGFEQGYQLVKQQKPALLFVDIQLTSQEGTGLQLAHALLPVGCAVIFISGYKDYAVEAFRLKATDYLLKPIRIEHLVESVEKVKKQLGLEQLSAQVSDAVVKPEALHIPSPAGIALLRQHDIIRCEADGAYTHFYLQGKAEKITSSLNIGQIEQKLGSSFLRVHKSHIINKNYIISYSRGEGLLVKMPGPRDVPVSRAQKDLFYQWLG